LSFWQCGWDKVKVGDVWHHPVTPGDVHGLIRSSLISHKNY
jgi:hypothetical protein